MELTVRQQSPGLGQNLHKVLDLTRDLQSTATQDPSTRASHLQVSALPERVAVQKARQDGVEDLIRQNRLNKGNCAAQYESDSLIYVELETVHNSCGSI